MNYWSFVITMYISGLLQLQIISILKSFCKWIFLHLLALWHKIYEKMSHETLSLWLPSVYADGSICLDILQNQWSPIYDVAAILTSIQASVLFSLPVQKEWYIWYISWSQSNSVFLTRNLTIEICRHHAKIFYSLKNVLPFVEPSRHIIYISFSTIWDLTSFNMPSITALGYLSPHNCIFWNSSGELQPR